MITTIKVAGPLWKELGGKYDLPLPADYAVQGWDYDLQDDAYRVRVEVPRTVQAEIVPWYGYDANGELALLNVSGDPMYVDGYPSAA